MVEPSLIPPGFAERDANPGPGDRCPVCATMLTNVRSTPDGRRQGRCPEHGTVHGVAGDRDAIQARSGYHQRNP